LIRILVVDGSQLMGWLVDSLTPASVCVQQTTSFDEAMGLLRSHPPHAAIFNIGPSDLPWAELHTICDSHKPRIPFLCCSAVEDLPADKLDMYWRLRSEIEGGKDPARSETRARPPA
jgi:two-component SAPR family response regulator